MGSHNRWPLNVLAMFWGAHRPRDLDDFTMIRPFLPTRKGLEAVVPGIAGQGTPPAWSFPFPCPTSLMTVLPWPLSLHQSRDQGVLFLSYLLLSRELASPFLPRVEGQSANLAEQMGERAGAKLTLRRAGPGGFKR